MEGFTFFDLLDNFLSQRMIIRKLLWYFPFRYCITIGHIIKQAKFKFISVLFNSRTSPHILSYHRIQEKRNILLLVVFVCKGDHMALPFAFVCLQGIYFSLFLARKICLHVHLLKQKIKIDHQNLFLEKPNYHCQSFSIVVHFQATFYNRYNLGSISVEN